MVGSLFDLMDAVDRKLGFALNLFERLARDRPHLSVYFTDGDLYVQPFLELGLFRPERAHFRQCVAVDHCSVTSTDYADYTDLRKEKKSQVNCQVVQHGFASLRNLRNLWILCPISGLSN